MLHRTWHVWRTGRRVLHRTWHVWRTGRRVHHHSVCAATRTVPRVRMGRVVEPAKYEYLLVEMLTPDKVGGPLGGGILTAAGGAKRQLRRQVWGNSKGTPATPCGLCMTSSGSVRGTLPQRHSGPQAPRRRPAVFTHSLVQPRVACARVLPCRAVAGPTQTADGVYSTMLQAMVKDWRARLQQPDLPFGASKTAAKRPAKRPPRGCGAAFSVSLASPHVRCTPHVGHQHVRRRERSQLGRHQQNVERPFVRLCSWPRGRTRMTWRPSRSYAWPRPTSRPTSAKRSPSPRWTAAPRPARCTHPTSRRRAGAPLWVWRLARTPRPRSSS